MEYGSWVIVAQAAGGGAGSFTMLGLLPYLAIFALFYFILIAPMRKKQKALQKMIGELKNGDRVITNGGIHGTVVGVGEQVIQLRVADQVKIEVSKSAVAGMQADPGETKS